MPATDLSVPLRLLCLGALLLLVACGQGGPADQAEAPPPPTVTVAQPLVRDLVEWDEFTGRFEATERVEIRARVSGYLDSVHFEDGQTVKRGELLFVIDPRPFKIAVEQAEAALESAAARLELARQELDRAAQLLTRENVSRSTYDTRLQESRVAEADVLGARAELRDAQVDLTYTEVRAPVAGRASNRRVDVGNLVTDTTLLTTVVALDPIYFVFDMSEADFLAYQRAVLDGSLPSTRDQETVVGLKLVDEETWTREGRMNFVDNVVDPSSGTVRARAIAANPDALIAPGQFGRIRVPGSPRYPAILVPDDAIATDQARRIVMTVNQDNIAEPRVVRPGPHELGLRIVRDGLTAEDRIVVNGLVRVRPGMPVTPEQGQIEIPAEFAAEAAAAADATAVKPAAGG
jgi:RND family efflux transporter MFP subunit